ncbi:MAG: mechanosensitive ion channel [Alphaproteobacteria bacterium]|nr:mechanosensitive ion channel [Alphaproteobacteria bacterium]
MRFFSFVFLLVLSCAVPAFAQVAAPVAAKVEEVLNKNETKLTDEQMTTVIQLLESQPERDAFLNKLKALKAATASTDPAKKEPVVPSVQALDAITNSMTAASSTFTMIVRSFADLPQVSKWLQKQFDSEQARAAWLNFFAQAAAAIVAGLVAKYIVKLFLRRPRRMLAELKFDNLPSKLGAFFGYHLLSLLPVIGFTAAALFTLGVFELEPKPAKAMVAFLDAFIVQHVITWVLQMVFAERASRLRFLPLADESAAYLFVWCTRLSAFIVFGFFLSQAALYLDVPKGSVHAFSSFMGLMITLMVVIIVLQNRVQVSSWLRGKNKGEQTTFVQSTRERVADVWHVLAIVYLVIGYVIAALDIEQGFTTLIKATLVTVVTFILFRFIISSIDHLVEKGFALPDELKRQFPFLEQRTNSYLPILERVVKAFAWIIGTLIILSAWGFDTAAWFASPIGKKMLSAAVSITITLFIVVVAWEFVSNGVDRYLQGEDAHGRRIERSARMRTLLPLIRYASHTTLIIIATFIILSEFGLDITPLLAGAGIIGLAVGFGAQTLVKDFITGLFILLEDTISVGDVVKVGDHSGVVETFTIRTLRLRDLEGRVHSIPFSEVTSIINQTKNFAYVLIEVGVAYDANLKQVMQIMKDVADGMRKDPAYARYIYEAIEVLGIERFDASSIAMRARMKTDGQKQWAIKREYFMRLKMAFDQANIEIPYPITTNIHTARKPEDLALVTQEMNQATPVDAKVTP